MRYGPPAHDRAGKDIDDKSNVSEAAALEDAPNRFRAPYGAARAAERAGDVDSARKYYSKLLEVARVAETDRPELREARDFVKEKQARQVD